MKQFWSVKMLIICRICRNARHHMHLSPSGMVPIITNALACIEHLPFAMQHTDLEIGARVGNVFREYAIGPYQELARSFNNHTQILFMGLKDELPIRSFKSCININYQVSIYSTNCFNDCLK